MSIGAARILVKETANKTQLHTTTQKRTRNLEHTDAKTKNDRPILQSLKSPHRALVNAESRACDVDPRILQRYLKTSPHGAVPECRVRQEDTQKGGRRKSVGLLDELVPQNPEPLVFSTECRSSTLARHHSPAPVFGTDKIPPVICENNGKLVGRKVVGQEG